jgi:1-acyl-sn-glycerol-3-phosphate acyltransferase
MDWETFQTTLREVGAYRTDPDAPRSRADRWLGRFDGWFYLRLCGIVFAAYRKAVKGRWKRPEWAASSFDALHLVEGCGGRVSVEGVRHLAEPGGPAVIAANHMSLLETFVVGCLVMPFGDACTVAKASLLRYPLFGRALRAINPVSVNRENPRQDLQAVLTGGAEALRQGRTVILFPQSTRTPFFDRTAFNSLGVKLAQRAGVPIVPLAVRTDFQGIGRWVRDGGRIDRSRPVRFRFGPPMRVERNAREVHARTLDFISACLREWGIEVRGDEPGKDEA